MVRNWSHRFLKLSGLVSLTLSLQACSISNSLFGMKDIVASQVDPLTLDPAVNKTLIGGEQLQFLAAGGLPPYTFETDGAGSVQSDGMYAAGFEYPSDTETITVRDSVGQSASFTVPIKTFKTQDNFNYTTAGSPTDASDMISTADGTLYVVGKTSSKWLVLKSTDFGVSWTTLDSVQSDVYGSEAKSISYDVTHGLYVSGYTKISGNSGKFWLVRRSLDNGLTWSTVHQYQLAANKDSVADSVSIAPNGNLFVAGFATDASNISQWTVFKSTDAGTSWSVSDSIANGKAFDVLVSRSNSNHIFVGGSKAWLIRASYDGGASWQDIDLQGTFGHVNKLAMTTTGHLLAVGYAEYLNPLVGPDGAYGKYGITRASSDNGLTWNTIDYIKSSWSGVEFTGVATSSNPVHDGKYYVTATFKDPSPFWDFHYTVRRSLDSGSTWAVMNDYQKVTNFDSIPKSITYASDDNIYSAGNTSTNAKESVSGLYNLVVRKFNTTNSTSTTVVNYSPDFIRSSSATSLVRTSLGHLFSVGFGTSVSQDSDLITRKSIDNGVTWVTVDTHQCGDFGCEPKEIISDSSGMKIFAIGNSNGDSTNDLFWHIRRSLDGGVTWQNHTWQQTATRPAYGNSIQFLSNGTTLIAAGVGVDAAYAFKWVVRRSTDSGATWTTVDNPFVGTPSKVFVDENDHIYVIGSEGVNRIIRKSINAGTSWSTIYSSSSTPTRNFHDIFVKGGNIYLLARFSNNSSELTKSTDGGLNWTTLDTQNNLYPHSLTISQDEQNILISGYLSETGGTKGFVKRSTDAGMTWSNIERSQLASENNTEVKKSVFCSADLSKICYVGFGTDGNAIRRWLFKILEL